MKDRQPTLPGRVKLTEVAGSPGYYYMTRADEPLEEGTALNRANLFDDMQEERYGVETPNEAFAAIVKQWPDVTLHAAGWTQAGGGYEYTVPLDGMLGVYEPTVSIVHESADTAEDDNIAAALIWEVETYDGCVVVRALEIPDKDLTIRLRGV